MSLGYVLDDGWQKRLTHLFTLQVDEVALTDELFGYLTDPPATPTRHPIVRWLRAMASGVVPVLESMVLDGVSDRPDVAHYVHALAAGDFARQLRDERLKRSVAARDELPSLADMPRLFRFHVDPAGFVDDAFAFVLGPSSSRYDREIVGELDAVAPDMIPTLEAMLLDGVDDRRQVAGYLRHSLGPDFGQQ